MKGLRVLSGLHVGAHIVLSPGRWRVMAPTVSEPGGDLDIVLEDWSGPALHIEVPAGEGGVGCCTGEATPVIPWIVHHPLQRGAVVLCLTDDAVPAPSDTELWARHLGCQNAPTAESPLRRIGRHPAFMAGATGMVLIPLIGLFAATSGQATTDSASEHTGLRQILREPAYRELRLREHGGRWAITGLLHDPADEAALRSAVARVARHPPAAAWDAIPRLCDTLHTALSTMPSQRGLEVSVQYAGDGVLMVRGHAPDPDALRRAGPRLQSDLGLNVKGLIFEVERSPTRLAYSAVVRAGDLSYAQRRDGTKVFEHDRGVTP